MKTSKQYPIECTSLYCPNRKPDCFQCVHYPKLQNFENWKQQTNATEEDPIWLPGFFTAREKDN